MTGSNPLHSFCALNLIVLPKKTQSLQNAELCVTSVFCNDRAPIKHSSKRRRPRLSATGY